MIYLDASALVTAVMKRAYAKDLKKFLDAYTDETVTSTIGFVETVRVCDEYGTFPDLLARLLTDHGEIVLDSQVRDHAARQPGRLRSLDAIHVASAAQLGSALTALVTYDLRMADAARDAGLPVAMPGLPQ